jgi:hypothetical protein
MYWDEELVGGTFVAVFFIVIFSVSGFWAANWFAGSQCANKANAMGFKFFYSFTTDCLINVKGQWVPLANYRVL